jgi:hypothetical protein
LGSGSGWNFPTGHSVHSTLGSVAVANRPAKQLTHWTAPSAGWYLPFGQFLHCDSRSNGPTVPAGQR